MYNKSTSGVSIPCSTMSSVPYELSKNNSTTRNERFEDDEDKSAKYMNNNLNQFKMKLFANLNKFKKFILIISIILFFFTWINDSSSNLDYNHENNKSSVIDQLPITSNFQKPKWWWPSSLWFKPDANVVIILAANSGGGVLRWKNEQEWSIERISINNKKAYAKRHGYALTIKDMTTAKRYSHEYREGWQKVEILKQSMREFPNAEWFWWLDLDTLIMEPEKSLEDHIFNRLETIARRSLHDFNPLKIELDIPYVNYNEQIDLLITQDCGGFNLGSFLIRNTEWSKLLLDIWFEPVAYEQKHMVWEHKEQDNLEHLYANQPWIRSRVGFLPLRAINAFPPGACSEFSENPRFFYNPKEHDFVVNMAGCNFGRDCWGEMQYYTTLMKKLQSRWYTKLFF